MTSPRPHRRQVSVSLGRLSLWMATSALLATLGVVGCDGDELTEPDDDSGVGSVEPEPGVGLSDGGDVGDDAGAGDDPDDAGGAEPSADAGNTPEPTPSPAVDAGAPEPEDDAGTTPSPEPSPDAPEPVRFVALGDTGEGNDDQYAVADVIESVCASQGCDYAILLGDNFYDVGVDGTDDPQWQDKFELPYANLDLPFYPALGNHDGGAGGSGASISTGNHQVDYTGVSEKWNMPDRYYRYSQSNVDMYALDTSSIFFSYISIGDYRDLRDDQANWLSSEFSTRPDTNWRIAYGHHPYLSNGKHYNAGSYEGYDIPVIGELWDGTDIKNFMEDNVCGQADLYLCGHDHNRQWHETTCNGTVLMVSGAGAKTTDFEHDQPTYFEDDTLEGFVWIEIIGDEMTVQWWNKNGVMEYEGYQTRPRAMP